MSATGRFSDDSAIVGCTLGGLGWAVLAGAALGSMPVAAVALAAALLTCAGAMRLTQLHPAWADVVRCLLIVWVCLLNVAFVNALYGHIPPTWGRLTTGKEQVGLVTLNVLLVGISLFGFSGLIRALVDTRAGRTSP